MYTEEKEKYRKRDKNHMPTVCNFAQRMNPLRVFEKTFNLS